MDRQLLLEATGTLLAFLVLYCLWKSKASTGINAPEPKGAWPIIGHLHLLGGKTPVFRTLAAMADKHGPIFTIQIGMRRALVVSGKETIMECFTTNDCAFVSRPKSAAVKYMGYDGAISALGPHGPYWRELRKVMTLELLSNRRLELLKHMRASEVGLCINDLYSLCVKQLNGVSEGGDNCHKPGATKVDMTHWFRLVTMNLMLRAIAGRRYGLSEDEKDGEARLFTRAMDQFMFLTGSFECSDVIPFIGWMDLQGHLTLMKQNAKVMDCFMSRWLEEHVQSRKNGQVKQEQDFMDVLLSIFPEDGMEHGHTNKSIIKGTALSLILGGSDTTTAAMIWALSLLLNHNKYLKLVRQELDMHVGRERWVEESDIKDLIYLQAVVKETLRLYPPGPLSIPRESIEDCHVAGYFVPKGTRLIVNVWKLHRDPRVWTDPCEFRPERFLDSNAKAGERGREYEFEYLPFGSGRRSCPGARAAHLMMHLTLACLLQGFDIATPTNEAVDMSEGLGLTLPKATPLEVVVSPRLKRELYLQ
ncbi:xanthotoxin 5-hydroxylase CYP82C4-like [Rhododendron vialii]|uniref:xanthotoxin 5-hydroxylase CYP82C4-like n=1 Tax=Rhododendron vialii TaxID=182163 RepID=UPI00265F92E8|nr:xanthotoxin 5-hydroxylase CYP82C4-like [Rhododendron vialii]